MTNDKTNQFYFSKVRYMCNFTPKEVSAKADTSVGIKVHSDLQFTILNIKHAYHI